MSWACQSTPYLIFLASLSVSRSINTSFRRIGPLMFRVIIRPLSLPSSTRTLTWINRLLRQFFR